MTATYWLAAALIAVVAASVALSPRTKDTAGFYRGLSTEGQAPGVVTLTLSLVTTWIFARSLLNAAILGYHFGIAGALAYSVYYLSFLTGLAIVDAIRFRHGFDSIQGFLAARFGGLGTACYNAVVAVRLLSEVFANLLVVGIVFGAVGTIANTTAVALVALVTLGYSMVGGLRASLRTDVMQMVLLLVALVALLAQIGLGSGFDWAAIAASSPDLTSPGWVLLAVAALQVVSYPMHDPVMMDRGLIADRVATRRSFMHAAWLSVMVIVAFGLIGVQMGLAATEGEALMDALARLVDPATLVLFNVILLISAVSTLDSTLSSASKLAVVDMKLAAPTLGSGRIAMAVFMAGGLALTYLGNEDLFGAVAVSGTASMFLVPVAVFSVWRDDRIAPWSFQIAFWAAMGGAAIYFLETSGHFAVVGPLTGFEHGYSQLLAICLAVLAVGFAAFAAGRRPPSPRRVMPGIDGPLRTGRTVET